MKALRENRRNTHTHTHTHRERERERGGDKKGYRNKEEQQS
jgi:hypothetical protein